MKSQKSTGESAEAIAARQRERRLSEIDALSTTQEAAADLDTDLRSIYGLRKLRNQASAPVPTTTTKPIAPVAVDRSTAGTHAAAASKNPVLWLSSLRPQQLQNGQNR
ncbi:MAG: hypothetical protein DI533_00385 [Cereibacter sphaeroides]|uniref:Uncharacterized protein n=1 Tax=Cereibacter sphaeroides TaxID=1063 RepID=A0A2W5UMU9_CERSP|nr:MAG: hypothetical protein DI533_00385 [Cereibacter sphaeroides]